MTLAGGLPLLVLFTHACEGGWGPNLIIHGTAGRVEWTGQATVFHTPAGQETLPRTGQPTSHMLERFAHTCLVASVIQKRHTPSAVPDPRGASAA